MQARPIRHRRARRTDLIDLLRIQARSQQVAPVPDRAMLRRFRRIVADLGNDFYVALIGERPVGFVQITYRRHVTLGLRGRVECLVVDGGERSREVAASLLRLAEDRARRRSCCDLRYAPGEISGDVTHALRGSGWVAAEPELRLDLTEARADCSSE